MNKKTVYRNLISPCGANCVICMGYLRSENSCPGCREDSNNKPNNCVRCSIKNCIELIEHNYIYCYECKKYPCKRLEHLDNRYKTNYNFSMINNLNYIREKGIDEFIKEDKKKWICEKCGGIICVHRGYCSNCGEIKYYHIGSKRKQIK